MSTKLYLPAAVLLLLFGLPPPRVGGAQGDITYEPALLPRAK